MKLEYAKAVVTDDDIRCPICEASIDKSLEYLDYVVKNDKQAEILVLCRCQSRYVALAEIKEKERTHDQEK